LVEGYYSRSDVLEALAQQCKNREIFLRAGESTSRRPLKVDSAEELSVQIRNLESRSNGAPVTVHASMEQYSNPLEVIDPDSAARLRTAWDYVIDVDGETIQKAKVTAGAVVGLLKNFGIHSFRVKFSGSRGFHIIMPGKAFDNFTTQEEFLAAYPVVPKRMTEFLSRAILPDQMAGSTLDYEVYQTRHLLRLAYGLNEKSGLVSLPVNPDEISSFVPQSARPERIAEVKMQSDTSCNFNEGAELLRAVSRWMKTRKQEERGIRIVPGERTGKNRIEWIERLLQKPITDGRHRTLWLIIAPYLVNVRGLEIGEAEGIALSYLERCNGTKRMQGSLRNLTNSYVIYAKRTGLKPISFAKLGERYPDLWRIIKANI